jgi:hypothetical protein
LRGGTCRPVARLFYVVGGLIITLGTVLNVIYLLLFAG